MKKSAICITLATLALAGCNNDEKNAQARLDNARSMYEQNEFFAAKNEIDSIRILFPQLDTVSLWAAISMGILLFIGVSVINILAVKKKVLSIWMHKS